jgi:hypothetical protein
MFTYFQYMCGLVIQVNIWYWLSVNITQKTVIEFSVGAQPIDATNLYYRTQQFRPIREETLLQAPFLNKATLEPSADIHLFWYQWEAECEVMFADSRTRDTNTRVNKWKRNIWGEYAIHMGGTKNQNNFIWKTWLEDITWKTWAYVWG